MRSDLRGGEPAEAMRVGGGGHAPYKPGPPAGDPLGLGDQVLVLRMALDVGLHERADRDDLESA